MEIQIKNIPDCLVDMEAMENRLHSHDFYQLMWFWHGTGSHQIDFNDEEVSPNKVFVISPGQLHQFKDLESPEGIIIQFDEGFFSEMDDNLDSIIKYSVFNAFHLPPYYIIDNETGERLKGIAAEMNREKSDVEKFAHDNYIYSLVKMFLIIIIREGLRTDNKHIYNNSAAYQYFINFRKELDHNYRRYHTVQQYATALRMSSKTLTQRVIQYSGQSPLKLINNKLIVEAQRMLKSKPMLIKEIAYELGFDDDSYFVKFFKRQTGLLPSEFKEKEQ